MAGPFDPYHRWLGIPPQDQPPHHYRLLGLQLFEDDPDVIESAADQRMAHLRTFQTGKHSPLSQKLLNEVAAAKLCLLSPPKRAAYDELLRQKLADTAAEAETPQVPQPVDPQLAGLFAQADRATPAVRARVAVRRRSTKLGMLVASAVVVGLLMILGLVLKGVLSTAETALLFDWPEDERQGATLQIDGHSYAVEPFGPLQLRCPPGEHRVVLGRLGFQAFIETVTLEEGETNTVRPQWVPAPAPPQGPGPLAGPKKTPRVDAAGTDVPPGAVLWMNFDKDTVVERGGRAYVRDLSGAGNDGVGKGISYTAKGRIGGGLLCPGGPDSLRLSKQLLTNAPEYTVAAWVLESHGIRLYSQYCGGDVTCEIAARQDGVVVVGAWNKDVPDNWTHAYTPEQSFPSGQWVFLAVRFRDTAPKNEKVTVTINGLSLRLPLEQVKYDDIPGTTDMWAELGGGDTAVLDEVVVYRRVLSDAEVESLHQRGLKAGGSAVGSPGTPKVRGGPFSPDGTILPTAEMEYRSCRWENGSPGVKMIPESAGFCFVSALSGRFEGGGEGVKTVIGDQQAWWLLGNSLQTELAAEAVSVSVPAPLKVERKDYFWDRDQVPAPPPTKMIRRDEGFCILTGVRGAFSTPSDGIDIRLGEDGFWYLDASTPVAFLRATSVRFLPPESVQMGLKEYTWVRGARPVKMIHKKEGFCLFAGFRGALRGYQQQVGVSLGRDGYWYLAGRSDQDLAARAISVRITKRTSGTEPPHTAPPDERGETGATAPGSKPAVDPPAGSEVAGPTKESAWVLDLEREINYEPLVVRQPPADAKVYLELSGVASWPVPAEFKEGKSRAQVNERISIELRDLPGAQISVTLVRHTDGFRLRIQSVYSGPDGKFPFTPSDVKRRGDTIPGELQKSEAELRSLPGQIRQNESRRTGLLAQLQQAQARRNAPMITALRMEIGNLTRRIDNDYGSLKRLPKQIESQRSLCKVLPELRRAVDSLHGKAQLECRVFVKSGEEELDLIEGKAEP